jgi:hypothetical protein
MALAFTAATSSVPSVKATAAPAPSRLELEQRLDKAVTEVRRLNLAARANLESKEAMASFLFFGLFDDDSEQSDAGLHRLRELGPQIDKWATDNRRWAIAGRRDDGSSYTPAMFLDQGKAYASAITAYVRMDFDASIFGLVAGTATGVVADVGGALKESGEQLKDVAKVLPWVLGGLVVLVAASYVVPLARR